MAEGGTELAIGLGRRQRVALLGGVGFAVCGLCLALVPGAGVPGLVIGLVTAAFFGPLSVWALIRSRKSEAIWVVADDGIRFPMHGYPTIPWSEVTDARIVSVVGQRFLAIDVAHSEAVMSQRGRLARQTIRLNLRRGWGFLAIPERQAPSSLEDLGMEIDRHRGAGGPLRPGGRSVPARPSKMAKLFLPETVVALQGILYLLRVASAPNTRSGALRAAIGAALVVGALLVRRRPKVGSAVVLAVEGLIVVLTLTLGHIAVAARLASLFFPMCVLIVLASRPSRPPPQSPIDA